MFSYPCAFQRDWRRKGTALFLYYGLVDRITEWYTLEYPYFFEVEYEIFKVYL
jgi:hypothetical protein